MKGPKTLAEGWRSYETEVLGPKCSRVQRDETEKAFYAGAAVMFDAFNAAASDPGLDATEDDVQRVQALYQELQDFSAKLAALAKPGGHA